MAKSADIIHSAELWSNSLSLFDPENLQELDILRQRLLPPSNAVSVALPEREQSNVTDANLSDADRIFEQFKIDPQRKDWEAGVIDIDIIHRGQIRIATKDWSPVIMYCKSDLTENNIVKQFRLHVLRYSTNLKLIYGTYRFKQRISKTWAKDYRCGKIVDAATNMRETMINLAYWLTAQPHAEKNFPTWEGLVEEAMTKIDGVI